MPLITTFAGGAQRGHAAFERLDFRSTWTPLTTQSTPSSGGSFTGKTVCNKFIPSATAQAISNGGSWVRLTFAAMAAADLVLGGVWIGDVGTGNVYNFGAATQRQGFFSGVAGATCPAGGRLKCDPIQYTLEIGKAFIIAFDVTTCSAIFRYTAQTAKYITYHKTVAPEAANTTKATLYANVSGGVYGLAEIEVAD